MGATSRRVAQGPPELPRSLPGPPGPRAGRLGALTWDPGWSLPDREPTSEQGASPWHQVALDARTQTLYPGCEQGSRERNGNLRFRSQETGCHWRTIEQRRVGGHSRACRMERQRPGVLGPLAPPAPGAAVPAHPAGLSSSDYPSPANTPLPPLKNRKSSRPCSLMLAARFWVGIKPIYIEMGLIDLNPGFYSCRTSGKSLNEGSLGFFISRCRPLQ